MPKISIKNLMLDVIVVCFQRYLLDIAVIERRITLLYDNFRDILILEAEFRYNRNQLQFDLSL